MERLVSKKAVTVITVITRTFCVRESKFNYWVELVDFDQETMEVADCSCPDKEQVIQKSPQDFYHDDHLTT